MFCSKCGAQISTETKFCSRCGADFSISRPVTSPSQRAENSYLCDTGRLLVSTKASKNRRILSAVCCAFMLIVGIFLISNFNVCSEMGEDIFDSKVLGNILGLYAIIVVFCVPVISYLGFRSYCNVYENLVTGMSALSLNPNSPMQAFQLRYDEIRNVTATGKSLTIYTDYATYEVLAMTHQQKALTAIQQRLAR